MDDAARAASDREHRALLLVLAAIGFLGCVALIAGTLVAQAFVPDYDWVRDTISDLAAGEWEIVMDLALYGFAAGLVATSLAAAHAHLGGGGWSVGVLALAVVAALVIVVAARNEYGDRDSEGVVIHGYLVYGLGALFLLTPLCMARGFGSAERWSRPVLLVLAALWAIIAPVFLLAPTHIDGLLERALGLIACAMICTMCTVFLRRALA
jgi:Protein of unknown function (DUF998)